MSMVGGGIVVLALYLLVMAFMLIIPIIIGVYVYKDATRRGMNAIMWTLVAVFAPSFIGLIIYLVVRENYSDLACPQCNTKITEQYVVCPGCGVKLKPACDNCGNPIQPEWKVCPRCTHPITGAYDEVVAPVKRKDKGLGKILILAIVVPILLVVIIAVSFMGMMTYTTSSMDRLSCSLVEIAYEEYIEDIEDDKIKKLLEDANKDKRYIALEYETVDEIEGDEERHYLLYVPEGGEMYDMNMQMEEGLFKDIFRIKLTLSKARIPMVYCIDVEREDADAFELYINGEKKECEVISFDYDPIGDCFDYKPEEYVKPNIYEGEFTEIKYDTFYSEAENVAVKNMLDTARKEGQARGMRYATTGKQGEKIYYYAIYIPQAGSANLFGQNMKWHIHNVHIIDNGKNGDYVYCISHSMGEHYHTQVWYNDRAINCEIEYVEFNPVEKYFEQSK